MARPKPILRGKYSYICMHLYMDAQMRVLGFMGTYPSVFHAALRFYFRMH